MEQARYKSCRPHVALGPAPAPEGTSPCRPSHPDNAHVVTVGDKEGSSRYGPPPAPGFPLPGLGLLAPHASANTAAPPVADVPGARPLSSGSSGRSSCSSSSGSRWRSSSRCPPRPRPRTWSLRVCERRTGGGSWVMGQPILFREGEAPDRSGWRAFRCRHGGLCAVGGLLQHVQGSEASEAGLGWNRSSVETALQDWESEGSVACAVSGTSCGLSFADGAGEVGLQDLCHPLADRQGLHFACLTRCILASVCSNNG